MNRTENAIRNTKYAILSKALTLIINFISRTIFIRTLGSAFLGINGLYTEILSVLSLTELGFGTALTYAMYKPVAKNDKNTIVKLLEFYKSVYRIIAGVVTVFGLALLPFLQYIIKGAESISLYDLRLYYLIFLSNTVISYFVTYRFSYLNALQRRYEISRIELILNTMTVIAQTIAIIVFRSFLAYLLIHTGAILISRFIIVDYLQRRYSIYSEKVTEKLGKAEKKEIFHEVRGLAVHQFASVAVHQTDNIIISSLTELGVIAVGFVSNYNMIMKAVLGFVEQLFQSITPGFGNLAAAESKDHFKKVFDTANFINFWLYGFCCIAFFILIPPFITMWIGSDKLIDQISFLLIVINRYLQGQCTVFNNARIAVGNFNKDKGLALAQALVNLVVSVWGAKEFGIVGVYIGTVVSRLVFVIFRPYSTYSLMFGKSCRSYYVQLGKYFASVCIAGIITYGVTAVFMKSVTIWKFIMASIFTIVIPNAIFYLLYRRTEEYRDLSSRLKRIMMKGR